MAKHAILSASGAYRWRACPPSARLEQRFPEQTSTYADEGTLAHAISELMIQQELGMIAKVAYKRQLTAFMADPLFKKEMLGYCQDYADYVIVEYNRLKAIDPNTSIHIEVRLDLRKYIPEGFGTGDVVINGARQVVTIDLKYGAGVAVNVVNNDQQKVYALGAIEIFRLMAPVDTVTMHIYQPRINNIANWSIPAVELIAWGETDLKASAEKAYKGEGEYAAGAHCKFCKAKAQCKALAEYNLDLARHEFAEAALLDDAAVQDVLSKLETLSFWTKAVKEYALTRALQGHTWEGFKVVETTPRRKITDENAVGSALLAQGLKMEHVYRQELLTLTELEKLVGKADFQRIAGPWVVKPSGRPELATVTDRRKEFIPQADALDDFKDVN